MNNSSIQQHFWSVQAKASKGLLWVLRNRLENRGRKIYSLSSVRKHGLNEPMRMFYDYNTTIKNRGEGLILAGKNGMFRYQEGLSV